MRELLIKAPEGYVIDLNYFDETNQIRFIQPKIKVKFPTEWELEPKRYPYIDSNADIRYYDVNVNSFKSESNRTVLPTKKHAEQMVIFSQLILMRERYREIEKINNPELKEIKWDGSEANYYVYLYYDSFSESVKTFSFKMKETRDEFAKNFGHMILQCKDILG